MKVVPLMALAQHYGVPTRFLDWTRKAAVAAYFGALEPTKPAAELAVWGINGRFLQTCLKGMIGSGGLPLSLPPRADKPHTFCQAGLVTDYFDPTHQLPTL